MSSAQDLTALPAFIRDSRHPLPPADVDVISRAAAIRLTFAVEKQLQTQWCWAAVSVSVARHYRRQTRWTQCEVASQERGAACCGDGGTRQCNQPHYLDRALECTGTLREYFHHPLQPDDVRREIGRNAPLGCRVGWSHGGGHFVVIAGYEDAADEMRVDVEDPDPFFASSTYLWEEFTNRYRGRGVWTHSYTTRGGTMRSPSDPPTDHPVRPNNMTN